MCLLQPYYYIKSQEKTIKEQKKNLEETETPQRVGEKKMINICKLQVLYPGNKKIIHVSMKWVSGMLTK